LPTEILPHIICRFHTENTPTFPSSEKSSKHPSHQLNPVKSQRKIIKKGEQSSDLCQTSPIRAASRQPLLGIGLGSHNAIFNGLAELFVHGLSLQVDASTAGHGKNHRNSHGKNHGKKTL
jgi:hypothetical protein